MLNHVYVVTVEGRMDGTYVFASDSDARAFANAVYRGDGRADVSETPVCDAATANELIASELEGN